MATSRPFLPYGRQCIEDDDIDAVTDVLRSDFLTTGPVVDAFEAKLADVTGAAHAIAVSSGTAALHLAAMALELAPGDEVIVPAITFLATANAARYVGAEVRFADVDPDTGLLDSETLRRALAETDGKARCVLPVHVNGQTADMKAIAGIARGAGLNIVEDACHALGGAQVGPAGDMVPVGANAFADMSVFSFHPVKTVAMGEGGAVTTNDGDLAGRLRLLRNIGMTRDREAFQAVDQAFDGAGAANPWYYEMAALGFNYRASALHCGLGLSQLGKLRRFVARRAELVALYRARLAPMAPHVRALPQVPGCEPAWHLAVVLVDFDGAGVPRADVMRALHDRGVGTQVHYIPVHRQPYYRDRYGEIDLAGADAYYGRALSLPLFAAMSDDDVDYVVEALGAVLGAGG